jgi:hypothetical protein
LTTDASNEGAGAILSRGEIGIDRPTAYASRSFSKAEKNYSTAENELPAIVRGIKYLKPYLYGRRFKVVSDHNPLSWIMGVEDTGSRLLRWRLSLEEYDYEVLYKPGVQNSNADALSEELSKFTVATPLPRQDTQTIAMAFVMNKVKVKLSL